MRRVRPFAVILDLSIIGVSFILLLGIVRNRRVFMNLELLSPFLGRLFFPVFASPITGKNKKLLQTVWWQKRTEALLCPLVLKANKRRRGCFSRFCASQVNLIVRPSSPLELNRPLYAHLSRASLVSSPSDLYGSPPSSVYDRILSHLCCPCLMSPFAFHSCRNA